MFKVWDKVRVTYSKLAGLEAEIDSINTSMLVQNIYILSWYDFLNEWEFSEHDIELIED